MADPTKYQLCITAGPSYDTSTHQLVPVNTADPVVIDSPEVSAKLHIRIQNYRGLPSSSPSTSAYFAHDPHKSDLYSIAFSFTPKHDINGDDLLFGNDFDRPIRDNLPYGFGTALRIVRWSIDPGMDGDVYADKPYLYGPLLSSINTLWIGDKANPDADADANTPSHQDSAFTDANGDNDGGTSPDEQDQSDLEASQAKRQQEGKEEEHGADIEAEGGSNPAGSQIRTDHNIPSPPASRMKHFLTQSHRAAFTFEAGREYTCDFFNPYLDFNGLALRLPGITLPLMRFWDGQPLRYTLKVRGGEGADGADCSRGGKVALCVLIALVPEEEVAEVKRRWEGQTASEHPAAAASVGVGAGAGAGRRPDMAGVGGGGGGGGGGKTEQSQDQGAVQTTEDDVD